MQDLIQATRKALKRLKSDSDYQALSQYEKDLRLEQYVIEFMRGK